MTEKRFEEFPSRESWLEGRKKGIGSSDAPVIMGVSRWKSPLMLFAEKTGKAPEGTEQYKEIMEWGLIMQPHILERYGKETGRVVVEQDLKIWRDQEIPFLLASLDGMAVHPSDRAQDGVVEVKNASAYTKQDWLQEPPIEAQVQLQHQMMVVGVVWGAIGVLIGGNEFYRTPDIPRHEKLIETMRAKEIEFMRRVELNDPPKEMDAHESTKAALKLLFPEDTGETVVLDAEAMHFHDEREHAKAQLKKYGEIKETADNTMRRLIGNATFGVLPNGIRYSYKMKKGYTVETYDVKPVRELRLRK